MIHIKHWINIAHKDKMRGHLRWYGHVLLDLQKNTVLGSEAMIEDFKRE